MQHTNLFTYKIIKPSETPWEFFGGTSENYMHILINILDEEQKRSTEGCSKLIRSVHMTSSNSGTISRNYH